MPLNYTGSSVSPAFPPGYAGGAEREARSEGHAGKASGSALSALRTRDVRRCLEPAGYRVEPGPHKYRKLRHDRFGAVLLPLRPSAPLSFVAVKQIAAALELTPEQLTAAVRSR